MIYFNEQLSILRSLRGEETLNECKKNKKK